MRGIMDECTHLSNFSVPLDPELSIIVSATHDGYIPRQNVQPLTDIWPGSQVRYIDGGHVSAILFNANVFRYLFLEIFLSFVSCLTHLSILFLSEVIYICF